MESETLGGYSGVTYFQNEKLKNKWIGQQNNYSLYLTVRVDMSVLDRYGSNLLYKNSYDRNPENT